MGSERCIRDRARHYPSETVKPAENKREAGPKEKKATTPKNDGKKEDAGE